jgi:hypothetical protein
MRCLQAVKKYLAYEPEGATPLPAVTFVINVSRLSSDIASVSVPYEISFLSVYLARLEACCSLFRLLEDFIKSPRSAPLWETQLIHLLVVTMTRDKHQDNVSNMLQYETTYVCNIKAVFSIKQGQVACNSISLFMKIMESVLYGQPLWTLIIQAKISEISSKHLLSRHVRKNELDSISCLSRAMHQPSKREFEWAYRAIGNSARINRDRAEEE